MSIYWHTYYNTYSQSQIGGTCSIGTDSLTYPRSVNIFGFDSLPYPEFRKYWYRNYGEMTDPFYPNYWNTYWDDSDYFRSQY